MQNKTTDMGDQLRELNARMFLRIVECARPGLNGVWILDLGDPVNDTAAQKGFMSALLRALLTPDDEHARNGAIEQAIKDTTTIPLDE